MFVPVEAIIVPIVFGIPAAVAIAKMYYNHVERMAGLSAPKGTAMIDARLERVEQAVESIAIENGASERRSALRHEAPHRPRTSSARSATAGTAARLAGLIATTRAMQIVRLTSVDVERFRAVRLEGLRSDPDGFRYSEAEDAAITSDEWAARLDRGFVVAAQQNGDLLGVGGFSRVAGDRLQHKGLIWGMYVRAAARGTGVADAIMRALIEHARGEVRQLQLTVMSSNARARAFYERHGFVHYAIEPQAVKQGNDYRDESSMWLLLASE